MSQLNEASKYVQNLCSEIQQIPVTFISINTSELHATSKLVIQNASRYNKKLSKLKAHLKYLSAITPLL